MPRTRYLRLRQLVLRAAASAICAAILVAIGMIAIYRTTEPPLLSMLIEPVSMLLLPGLLVSLVAAGAHDFNPNTVVYATFAWYMIFFYLIFTWRYRRHARLFPGSDL